MTRQPNKPIKEFKAGCVRASVWATQTERNGRTVTRFSVTFEKRFRDSEGTWRSTSVLFPNDIPKARLVLDQAFQVCVTQDKPAASQAS